MAYLIIAKMFDQCPITFTAAKPSFLLQQKLIARFLLDYLDPKQ
jgi:hypothetical protein